MMPQALVETDGLIFMLNFDGHHYFLKALLIGKPSEEAYAFDCD